ncbi:MAG TPA: hypothetical protein VEC57_15705 [Candidatus Limnocylindrales bacterium]|nr:hypothetical protein [Candidatus Limnocylindrales bacterium]
MAFIAALATCVMGTVSIARADIIGDGVECLADLQAEGGGAGSGTWGALDGTGLRDTAAVLDTLRAIGRTDSQTYANGVDGLANQSATNNDFRARRLASLLAAGITEDGDLATLLANQNGSSGGNPSEPNHPEGGWGVTEVFGTDSLTTALAIDALRAADMPLALTIAGAVVTAPTQSQHSFEFPAGASGLALLVRQVTGSVRLFIDTPSSGTLQADLSNISSPTSLGGLPSQAGTYTLRLQSLSGSPNTYSLEVRFQSAGFDTARITAALAYLAAAQNGDGSWGLRRGESGQLGITAQVVRTLARLGGAFVAPAIVAEALDWIEDRQHDGGGFGQDGGSTVYETALAVLALKAGGRTTPSVLDPAHQYLADEQQGSGCWNEGDAYATALALHALFAPDDGLFCNGHEICNVIEGCSTVDVPQCDDGVTCTEDACSEELDECLHARDDSACDDGLYCNGSEICDENEGCLASESVDGAPVVDCDDHVPCTIDACDELSDSCTHVANHAACADESFCNGDEICSTSEGCIAGSRSCVDAHACTLDGCDEAADACTHSPNDTACADTNPCSDDSCSAVAGCTHTPNTDSCDDGDECTENDVCAGGQCAGTAIPQCTATTTTTTLPEQLCGDFNGSGTITASDALGALRTAVGTATCALALCDFNGSGTVTAQDALAILRTAVGHALTPNCPAAAAVAGPSTTTTTTTTTTTLP